MANEKKKKASNIQVVFFALVAASITFLVYLPASQNGFVTWDDGDYVYRNEHIQNINPEFLRWAFTEFNFGNWHPLTWVSHAFDYALWGLKPMGHHFSSILLHSINTLLVTLLTHKLLRAFQASGKFFIPGKKSLSLIALITGLLFGLHPLHVESVAWVSERKDLLCAFFYLLSLLFYLRFLRNSQNDIKLLSLLKQRDYLACLVMFVLALMSKPMAVSLPIVLLLIDWLLGAGLSLGAWKAKLIAKAPFLALALVSAIITIVAQKSGEALTTLAAVPLSDRLWVASYALTGYLQKMIWPSNLLPYYPFPKSVSWFSIQYLGSAILITGITLAVLLNCRRHRGWVVAWGYYIITLLPVLGIIKVGGQAMADRYTYLPSIAPFILLATALVWGVHHLKLRGRPAGQQGAISIIVLLSLVGAMSFLTQKQVRIWKNGETLWGYVIQHTDQSFLAYKLLGLSLFERAQYPAAIEKMNKALSLNPLDVQLLNNLALSYLDMGELDKARQMVDRALFLEKDAVFVLNTLGEIHLAQKDYPRANEVFFRAMQLDPENPLRVFNLAVSFDKLEDAPQACIYWRRFMELDVTGNHDLEIIQHLYEIGCPVGSS